MKTEEIQEDTRRNSVEQGRAKAAFFAAETGMQMHEKEYLSFVNDLPMLIKVNGLGAAIAFADYKNKASQLVNQQLEAWLKQADNQHLINLNGEGNKLSRELTLLSSTKYKAITIEVLAYLTWLRRFAKGLEKK